MKIGIGLPAQLPGTTPDFVLEWARKADKGPFSCLSLIDRLVYPNYEPLIVLTAAAAVTQRVGLMTAVLLVPLRNTGILAKEVATLDVISHGRLTLGIGVGGREDDFRAAPALFRGRGKRLEEQIAVMRRIWSDQPVADDVGPIGPRPVQEGGPPLLIGGFAPVVLRRAGRLADGYLSGGTDPATVQSMYRSVADAWQASGRLGKPRLVVGSSYALGPNSQDRGASFLRDYYRFQGPGAEGMVQRLLSSPAAIRRRVQEYADIGVDELALWPTVAEPEQLDRLADVVG
jgi:alkanesulfonate monooxygenase SsuD/methylene tetrahydromethanopterin reductase-like flavin-dependent oxidoreductase (luciferase family)